MTLLYPEGESDYTIDCSDNQYTSWEYIYTNKTADDFETYVNNLNENSGMTQTAHNTLGSVIDAYTYSGGGRTLYTYFAKNDESIRVIVTEGEEILPQDDYVAPETATYKMAQLGLNTDNGMSYVFTLSDGSYLVYDGGSGATDAALLKDYMGENPVIAGWVITHAHTDHYGAFEKFLTEYEGQFTLERVFYNAGSPSYIAEELGVELEDHKILKETLDEMCPADTKLVRVHTGQTIKVRDAEISVLYTPEDYYNNIAHDGETDKNVADYIDANDMSLVTKVTLGGKSVLMMGDAVHSTHYTLVEYYSGTSVLDSDVIQIAHHGNLTNAELTDVARDFYNLVTPDTMFCPTVEGNCSSCTFNQTFGVNSYKFHDSLQEIEW